MKNTITRIAWALLLTAVVAGIAWASSLRVHERSDAVSLLPSLVSATSRTSNDINVRKYIGQGKLILDAQSSGTATTSISVVVQQSALLTGQTNTWTGDAGFALNMSTSGTPTISAKFVQEGNRQIKHLDLVMKRTGTIANDKVITAYLHSNMTTTPNTTRLTSSATVSAQGIDTNWQTVRFSLAAPYQLTDATTYWISLDSTYAASDTNYVSWQYATVAAGGTSAYWNGSVWTASTTSRPLVKTYQYNFTDEVTFTPVFNTTSFQQKGINLDEIGGFIRSIATASGTNAGSNSLILIAPTQQQ